MNFPQKNAQNAQEEVLVAASATFQSGEQDFRERKFQQIIGNSSSLEAVLEKVERVAPTDSTVLVEGETGTGKELIARAIHNLSKRCGRPSYARPAPTVPYLRSLMPPDSYEPLTCPQQPPRQSSCVACLLHVSNSKGSAHK